MGLCDKLQPVVFEICDGMTKKEMIRLKNMYILALNPML